MLFPVRVDMHLSSKHVAFDDSEIVSKSVTPHSLVLRSVSEKTKQIRALLAARSATRKCVRANA